jgi:hypothetical protein
VDQAWLIVLDPVPGQSGALGYPWKAARAPGGRGTGKLAKPMLRQRLGWIGFDELEYRNVRGILPKSIGSGPGDASVAMGFLANPQLTPQIYPHIVPLGPPFGGIAHGVERGQDQARPNEQSRPEGAFGPDLDEVDERLLFG